MKIPEFIMALLIIDVASIISSAIVVRQNDSWKNDAEKYGPRPVLLFAADAILLGLLVSVNRSLIIPFNFTNKYIMYFYAALLLILMAPPVYLLLFLYGELNFGREEQ